MNNQESPSNSEENNKALKRYKILAQKEKSQLIAQVIKLEFIIEKQYEKNIEIYRLCNETTNPNHPPQDYSTFNIQDIFQSLHNLIDTNRQLLEQNQQLASSNNQLHQSIESLESTNSDLQRRLNDLHKLSLSVLENE